MTLLLSDRAGWTQTDLASLVGTVVDASTGETLPAANVLIRPGGYGTATDRHGRFMFKTIMPGKYQMLVSFIGFEVYQDSVFFESGHVRHLHIALKPKPVPIPEVTVSATRDRLMRQVNLSQDALGGPELRMTASVAEPDLFRSLQFLPGVIQANDFNTRFYVRGGHGNENHVLVDGITIHNPYHALGFFSTFDVDAIKAVEVYRGIFPARYSERLSSVTNVILRDGNAQRFAGSGMLSMATSKLVLEGPLLKYNSVSGRKWTWMLSGRRTYLDQFIEFARKNTGLKPSRFPFYFFDLSGKTVFDSGRKTRLILHGFYGFDRILAGGGDTFPDTHWKNRALGLQWYHFLSPQQVWSTRFTYSDFRSDVNDYTRALEEGEEILKQRNSIRELSLGTEWDSRLSSSLSLNLGYGFSRFNIDQYLDSFFRQVFQGRWRQHDQHKMYLTLTGAWKDRWLFDYGLTYLHFSTGGAHKFSPRLGIKYLLTDDWHLKAGYGRHYQILTTINDDDDPIIFFDAWIPSPQNRPVARADHYGLGLEFSRSSSLETDLEFYYRRYDNLTRYNRSQRAGEPFYLNGWAESYGMEIRAHYNLKTYYGFINYTFGRAVSHFFLRNQPMRYENDFRWQTFPSASDVRHILNAVLGIRPGGKWDFSSSLVYQSGRPYTGALGHIPRAYEIPTGTWPPFNWPILEEPFLQEIYTFELVYSKKNSLRFPFYQRVDFRAARNFIWLNMDCSFFVQVYNIFFRKNSTTYLQDQGLNHKSALRLPVLPTVGISFRF